MCYFIYAFTRLSKVFNCTLCTVKFMYTQYSYQFLVGFTLHTQPKQTVSIALELVQGEGTDQ